MCATRGSHASCTQRALLHLHTHVCMYPHQSDQTSGQSFACLILIALFEIVQVQRKRCCLLVDSQASQLSTRAPHARSSAAQTAKPRTTKKAAVASICSRASGEVGARCATNPKKRKKKHDSSVSVPRQTCIVTDLDPCSWGSYLTNTNLTLNLNLAAWLPSNP
jgi:hypothetical protein